MSITSRYSIHFEPTGRCAVVKEGTSLLEAARKIGIELSSNCNGQGDCGECTVSILSGQFTNLTDIEEDYFKAGELQEGQRLACCVRVLSSAQVYIPDKFPK